MHIQGPFRERIYCHYYHHHLAGGDFLLLTCAGPQSCLPPSSARSHLNAVVQENLHRGSSRIIQTYCQDWTPFVSVWVTVAEARDFWEWGEGGGAVQFFWLAQLKCPGCVPNPGNSRLCRVLWIHSALGPWWAIVVKLWVVFSSILQQQEV